LFLQAAGIDCGQGWFWSKALPPEELLGVIERGFGDRQQELLALLHAAKGR
jgi:sensor c-di-GMP phosphodiesterase-like protein